MFQQKKYFPRRSRENSAIWSVLAFLFAAFLSACGTNSSDVKSERHAATVIPAGIFPEKQPETPDANAIEPVSGTPPWRVRRKVANTRRPEYADAWIYTSPASQKLLFEWGIDPATGTRLWENFCKAKEIGYSRVGTARDLNNIKVATLLILPSVIVLTEDEKNAIARWRERGGSVLSTWKSGVHNVSDDTEDYSFMESVLGVKASNSPPYSAEETFLVSNGGTPVIHQIPPGTKVYMERVPKLPPLRLRGAHEAAKHLDWARSFRGLAENSLVTYEERVLPNGRSSRAVALGYAEQSWMRMDPLSFGSINTDIVNWLIRTPTAHVSNWPSPYSNAVIVALQGTTPHDEEVTTWAKRLQANGWPATFYFPASAAPTDLAAFNALAIRGQDIGWLQAPTESGSSASPPPIAYKSPGGQPISAPMTRGCGYRISSDIGRQSILDHCLLSLEADDNRTPIKLSTAASDTAPSAIGLPITLANVEDRIKRANPAEGFTQFQRELSEAGAMGSLSVIRIQVPDSLTTEFRTSLLDQLKTVGEKPWITTAAQVADWWRERARVKVSFSEDEVGLRLLVNVSGKSTIRWPIAVDVSNATSAGQWTLKQPSVTTPVKVSYRSEFQTHLRFENLPAGEHVFELKYSSQSP